jgi:hypothetical protein
VAVSFKELVVTDVKITYQQTLTVTGILAGIIFAAMTFLMQSQTQITFPHWLPNIINYKELLIGGFAVVSVLLILSTVGMITIAAGVIDNPNYVQIMGLFATLSYDSLIVLIPILVIPFSLAATIAIIIIEIFWVVVFHKYAVDDTIN